MTRPRFQHTTPAFRTFCGPDALDALPRELDRLGARRAVVVCGASMAGRHAAQLRRVEAALGERWVRRFAEAREHSPLPSVAAARRALADASADAVVAVGGGSAVVTARAATILLGEDRDVRDVCTRPDRDGGLVSPRLSAPKLPIWVVPSTPTTAYAKAGAAVQDPATGERLALFDPKSRARGVVFDPDVALTAPVTLTMASGLNAFAMAVEGLQADADDVLADALLTHALRMLAEWLPRLCDAPDAAEPRLRLMVAALLSGQGSDFVGGGLAQALSHAAGPRSSTANGVVHALLLPHVMRFTAPVAAARTARIADALRDGSEPGRQPGEPTPQAAVAAVERVLALTEVPVRLRDVGVRLDDLSAVVEHTLHDWVATRAPRTADRDELTALVHAAW